MKKIKYTNVYGINIKENKEELIDSYNAEGSVCLSDVTWNYRLTHKNFRTKLDDKK